MFKNALQLLIPNSFKTMLKIENYIKIEHFIQRL